MPERTETYIRLLYLVSHGMRGFVKRKAPQREAPSGEWLLRKQVGEHGLELLRLDRQGGAGL